MRIAETLPLRLGKSRNDLGRASADERPYPLRSRRSLETNYRIRCMVADSLGEDETVTGSISEAGLHSRVRRGHSLFRVREYHLESR